jgi:hypothetical protein
MGFGTFQKLLEILADGFWYISKIVGNFGLITDRSNIFCFKIAFTKTIKWFYIDEHQFPVIRKIFVMLVFAI